MRKEYYDTYRSLGICTACGNNKAEEGRILCLECALKDSSRQRNYDKKRKAQYIKRKKEICDALGVCTTCFKKDKYKGKQCIDCYLKRKRKYKEKQADLGVIPRDIRNELEVCFFCGEPSVKGYKVCEKHLAVNRRQAMLARSFVDTENHKWKKDKHMEILRLRSYCKDER